MVNAAFALLLLGLASLVASQPTCSCEVQASTCEPIIDDGDGTCSDGTPFTCDKWGCSSAGASTCEILTVTYLHYTDRPSCEVSETTVVRPIGEIVILDNLDETATDRVGGSNIDTLQFKGASFTISAQYTVLEVDLFLGQFDGGDVAPMQMGIYNFASGDVDFNAPLITFNVSSADPAPGNGLDDTFAFRPVVAVPAFNNKLAAGGPYIFAMRMVGGGSITWNARATAPVSNDPRLVSNGYFFFNSSAVEWQPSSLENMMFMEGTMAA
mmetsp:Transcript_22621/g.60123  ORF Transcript_22621/g.60123 Transcript_22621/m.60123 type:complete len:269 (+) Transcript_22621:210-1016(+)